MAIGIGAALLGGSVISGIGNIASANRAAEANEAMSREQMQWQQWMTSHAHQIEVGDMRNAGLNPILSATGGRGASFPAGAHGTAPDARLGDALREGASSALALKRQEAETRVVEAHADVEEKKRDIFVKGAKPVESGVDALVKVPGAVSDWIGEKMPPAIFDAGKTFSDLGHRAADWLGEKVPPAVEAVRRRAAGVVSPSTAKRAAESKRQTAPRPLTESQKREVRRYGPNRIGGKTPDWRWKSLGR